MTHSAKRDFRGSGWGFILACIGSAVGMAASQRFGRERPGRLLALLPAAGSPATAIGYSVVVGWIFKYLIHALRGTLRTLSGAEAFSRFFGAAAASNIAGQRPDQSGPVPNRRGLGFIPWPNTSSAALRCRC